jgi:hypothetical protein
LRIRAVIAWGLCYLSSHRILKSEETGPGGLATPRDWRSTEILR